MNMMGSRVNSFLCKRSRLTQPPLTYGTILYYSFSSTIFFCFWTSIFALILVLLILSSVSPVISLSLLFCSWAYLVSIWFWLIFLSSKILVSLFIFYLSVKTFIHSRSVSLYLLEHFHYSSLKSLSLNFNISLLAPFGHMLPCKSRFSWIFLCQIILSPGHLNFMRFRVLFEYYGERWHVYFSRQLGLSHQSWIAFCGLWFQGKFHFQNLSGAV